jgi:hypothetical protein
MLEQRLSVRLAKMWDKLAELNPPPMFSHMNQATISDIWQQCAVLRIEPNGENSNDPAFVFDYIGDKSRALLPNIHEGRILRMNTVDREVKKYLEALPEVIRTITTVVTSGTLVGARNKMIKYRISLLPFTNNSGAVSHIMVGFSWIEC